MVVNADLSHIHPAYQQYALLDDEDRVEWIRSDRYLAYRRADATLKRLEDLLHYPTRDRMPCMLLYGPPGMGKTKILRKFIRNHPPVHVEGSGTTIMPVVVFQMPSQPDDRDFYIELLIALGGAYNSGAAVVSLRNVARRLMRDMRTRMLMIDEVHAMLAGTARQQRAFLNTIRFLTNDLRIPIVCAGTDEARAALITDQQLADRFEALELRRWKNDEEFRQLLGGFSAILPLRLRSALDTVAVRRRVLDMTDGVTVRIFRLIETVATEAIRDGREMLDESSFADEELVLPLVSMTLAPNRRMAR
ncbi:transposase [Paramagnetospirillum kuznetsovii]|uniref:Transposase n=1 Tax=Paramagnetospirillum kuznetsovii TaxID=2053833 RepID=A0A364NUT8_9PROT|nr:TniB family NTP-binding protein [Paramagnetospirillum kuznetsovii]RAU20770.1 transposase [Paramagnetospirillum kuznetsovii]